MWDFTENNGLGQLTTRHFLSPLLEFVSGRLALRKCKLAYRLFIYKMGAINWVKFFKAQYFIDNGKK